MNIIIKSWVIISVEGSEKGKFWSNDREWVTLSKATVFNAEERKNFDLIRGKLKQGAYWVPKEIDPLTIRTIGDMADVLGHFPHDLPVCGNSRGMGFCLNFNLGYTTPREGSGWLFELANENDEGANTTLEISLE